MNDINIINERREELRVLYYKVIELTKIWDVILLQNGLISVINVDCKL